MAYKWHNLVVSILCILAVAGVVISLVSTFNSINLVKKKRKRSVDSEESPGGGEYNVMEINQNFQESPTKRNTDADRIITVPDDESMSMAGADVRRNVVKYLEPVSHQLARNITGSGAIHGLANKNLNETKQFKKVKKSPELSTVSHSKDTSKYSSRDLQTFSDLTNSNSGNKTQQLKTKSRKTVQPSPSNVKLISTAGKSTQFPPKVKQPSSHTQQTSTKVEQVSPSAPSQSQQSPSTKVKTPAASSSSSKAPLASPAVTQPVISNFDPKPKYINGVEIPVFPQDYHATGLLILPRSGIAEPFEVWYAPSVDKSRIDYYYGTDKTFQRGDEKDYGMAYKYVPMYNDVNKSFDGCWSVKGREERRIVPQIITPNITWFKYNKTEVYTGTLVTKWTYHYTAFGMKNFQSVWITMEKPHRPIRYEMLGFDMMLGSYYDNYVIEYISFDTWDRREEIFDVPKNIQCFQWGNSLEASYMVNPMSEFAAFSADSAVDHSKRYEEFKEKHYNEKKKKSDVEHVRKHVFKDNARYINSHNRKNVSFKLRPNQFADKFEDEISALHTSLEKDSKDHKGAKPLDKIDQKNTSSLHVSSDTPDKLDWRDYGAVTAVKGQGICGSCYAFSASEATEGAWYRKTGKKVDLSTQQLIDCSWGMGNHGCKGGHYAGALSWIYLHGIATAKSYGKYLGQEGYCHNFNDTWFGANIDGFFYVPVWNKTALKRAVAMHGPVAVSINTRPLSFKFYSHGIYNDPLCEKNKTTHSALVIGYGNKNGQEYWIVKNSWSDLWGENGFMKISMDNDLCGITEYPVAVIVHRPSFVFPRKEPINEDDNQSVSSKDKKKPNIALEPKQGDLELKLKNLKSHSSKSLSDTTKQGDLKVKKTKNSKSDKLENKNKLNLDDDDDDDEVDDFDRYDHKNVGKPFGSKPSTKKVSATKDDAENITIPFSGLHISQITEDLRRFKELLNDDTPEMFEAFDNEFQTVDNKGNSATQTATNAANNGGTTNNVAGNPATLTHTMNSKINSNLNGNINNNNNHNHNNIKMGNNFKSKTMKNVKTTSEKNVPKKRKTKNFQQMTKQEVRKLLTVTPTHQEKQQQKPKSKQKPNKTKGNKKTDKKEVTTKEQRKNKNMHFVDLKENDTMDIHKNRTDKKRMHDSIKALDDLEFSNANTEHSKEKLIKTHKHSKRLKLNPESIGSLDIGDRVKPRPLKATNTQDLKRTASSSNLMVAHAKNELSFQLPTRSIISNRGSRQLHSNVKDSNIKK